MLVGQPVGKDQTYFLVSPVGRSNSGSGGSAWPSRHKDPLFRLVRNMQLNSWNHRSV